ncbi:hypothetical protein O3P69_003881 [Scylla paramamosain]|uniref:Uncharacterized protein n=1 Tax=Scylla paramamosain TaxID=85552 RepID=A0AAW0UGD8_SCYPA
MKDCTHTSDHRSSFTLPSVAAQCCEPRHCLTNPHEAASPCYRQVPAAPSHSVRTDRTKPVSWVLACVLAATYPATGYLHAGVLLNLHSSPASFSTIPSTALRFSPPCAQRHGGGSAADGGCDWREYP